MAGCYNYIPSSELDTNRRPFLSSEEEVDGTHFCLSKLLSE